MVAWTATTTLSSKYNTLRSCISFEIKIYPRCNDEGLYDAPGPLDVWPQCSPQQGSKLPYFKRLLHAFVKCTGTLGRIELDIFWFSSIKTDILSE